MSFIFQTHLLFLLSYAIDVLISSSSFPYKTDYHLRQATRLGSGSRPLSHVRKDLRFYLGCLSTIDYGRIRDWIGSAHLRNTPADHLRTLIEHSLQLCQILALAAYMLSFY